MSWLVLVAAQVLAFTPVQPTSTEAGSVCEVLKHPREYRQTHEPMIGQRAEVVAFSIEHVEEILEFLHPPAQ